METQKNSNEIKEELSEQIAITDAYLAICQDNDIKEALEKIPKDSRELVRWLAVMTYIKGKNDLIASSKKVIH